MALLVFVVVWLQLTVVFSYLIGIVSIYLKRLLGVFYTTTASNTCYLSVMLETILWLFGVHSTDHQKEQLVGPYLI